MPRILQRFSMYGSLDQCTSKTISQSITTTWATKSRKVWLSTYHALDPRGKELIRLMQVKICCTPNLTHHTLDLTTCTCTRPNQTHVGEVKSKSVFDRCPGFPWVARSYIWGREWGHASTLEPSKAHMYMYTQHNIIPTCTTGACIVYTATVLHAMGMVEDIHMCW